MSPEYIPVNWIVLGLVAGIPLLMAATAILIAVVRPAGAGKRRH